MGHVAMTNKSAVVGTLITLTAVFSSMAQAQNGSRITAFDPITGFSLGNPVIQQLTVTPSTDVKIVLEAPEGVTHARLQLATGAGSCPAFSQDDNTVPFEFTVSAPDVEAVCDYTLHMWEPNWAYAGNEDFTLNFSFTQPDDPNDGFEHPAGSNHIAYTNGSGDFSDFLVGVPAPSRSEHGNRFTCVVSHFSYDDPIIFPGEPGLAHLHMFWGNTRTNAYSTPETLPYEGNSSCQGGINYRVGAWMPALFNEAGEVVIPDRLFVYYKTFLGAGGNYDAVQPVPQGLEMLATRSTMNYGNQITIGPTDINGELMLEASIAFPSCVATSDGTLLGQPILSHRHMPGDLAGVVNSHVSYPGGPASNEVDCPSSHPYRFPTPQFQVAFRMSEAGDNPYLSSDAMMNAAPFSTLHGDYVFGMDPLTSELMVQCIREARNCTFDGGASSLSERFYSAETSYRLYETGVQLYDDVDRTPFGDSLQPMLSEHNHDPDPAPEPEPEPEPTPEPAPSPNITADFFLYNAKTGGLIASMPDGARFHSWLADFPVNIKVSTNIEVGSVEFSIRDMGNFSDSALPYYAFGDVEGSSYGLGEVLGPGRHQVTARFFEQADLGGSYLGEATVTFFIRGKNFGDARVR